MDNKQFLTAFQANYDRAYNFFGSSGELQIMLSLACKYTMANKSFSGVALEKITQEIEEAENRDFPFQARSKTSYKIASYLQDEEDLQQAIQRLIENDKLLENEKFKSNHYRVLAALFLEENQPEHAIRAKQLFDEMNKHHPFLTSNDDMPYAVLLTRQENDYVQQAETMVTYYKELRNHQFQMGNSLQALTQIMTIYSIEYNDLLCQYIVKLRDELVNNGVKVKKDHYPYLGILALAATDDYKIDEIVTLHTQLCTLKALKQSKDYALIVAIQKAIRDLHDLQAVVDITKIQQLDLLMDITEFTLDLAAIFPSGVLSIFNSDLLN